MVVQTRSIEAWGSRGRWGLLAGFLGDGEGALGVAEVGEAGL